MSGDNRTVSTDALETLGTIIDSRAGRDAIHLAVEPVKAGESLQAGQHVGIVNGVAIGAKSGARDWAIKKLGIVDPFLTKPVEAGQMFWLVVYPRQIASLRHVWTHQDFPDEQKTPLVAQRRAVDPEDELILRQGAAAKGINYGDFMAAINEYISDRESGDSDNTICFGEDLNYDDLPTGFWDAYGRVTGKNIPESYRDVYFRCAC